MRIEDVLETINGEVNSSFSKLDSWFNEEMEVLNFRPLDGGWNGIEILEHVMLTNHYLLMLIDKGSTKALKRAQTAKVMIDWNQYVLNSESMQHIGKSRSFIWTRPDHMEPKGDLGTMEIRSRLCTQKGRCIRYLEQLSNGEGVLCMTTMSVNNLGKIDVYQYIYFLALHIKRHSGQLERNKSEYLELEVK